MGYPYTLRGSDEIATFVGILIAIILLAWIIIPMLIVGVGAIFAGFAAVFMCIITIINPKQKP